MRRSKRNAAMFLAGAVLVGGVTGAAGNVWYSQYGRMHSPYRGPSEQFFEEIGLSCQQRSQMDSILHTTERKIRTANAPLRARYDSVMTEAHLKADPILAPGKPIADSIRAASHAELRSVMTAKQQARYDELVADAAKQQKEWEQHPQGAPDQKDGACGGNWHGGWDDGHHPGPGGPVGPGGPGGSDGRGGPGGPPDRPRHPI